MLELLFELMASVFQIPRSPFWFAAFTDAKGRRVQKTTKRRDRKSAYDIARAWEKAAESARAGTITEAQARRVLAEIVKDATGEDMNFHTCQAWFAEWIAGKKGAVGERSAQKYQQVTNDFLAHLGERAGLTIAAINPKDVRSFRDTLAAKGLSPSTVNQTVRKVLSVPFAAAQKLGYIPTNPCAAVEPLRDDATQSRDTFTPAHVAALVAAADNDWRGMILCGYYTGLRLRDAAGICWGAIDLKQNVLVIKPKKSERRGVELTLPIHPDFAAWLRSRPRGIGKAPVFPKLAERQTSGEYGLSGRFQTVMAAAGVSGRVTRQASGEGRSTTSLSFHSLRHSFVSALANAGVEKDLRKRLSGHADDQSHARYTHHDIENLRGAVAKMPSVL